MNTPASSAPQSASTAGTWIRRIALAVLVLIVIVAAGLAWVATHFDAARVQGLLVDWMRDHNQRELRIDGPLKLSVFPRIELHLSKVALSEHAQATQFAAIEDAALAVQVMPLFSGRLVVDRISASGVQVRFTRDAQGRMNIDDLIGKGQEPEPDQGKSKPLQLESSGLDLQNVKLHIEDQIAHVQGDVSLDQLKTGPLAEGRATNIDLAVSADLREPKVKAVLKAQGKAGFKPDTKAWQIEGLKLSVNGDVPGASGVQLQAAGSASFDPGTQTYKAQDIKLGFAGMAAGLKVDASELELGQALWVQPADGRAGEAQIGKLKFSASGQQGGQPFKLKAAWDAAHATQAANAPAVDAKASLLAQLAAWSVKAEPASAQFSFGSADGAGLGADGEFSMAAVAGELKALQLSDIKLQVKGHTGTRKFTANLATQARIDGEHLKAALEKLQLQAQTQQAGEPDMKVQAQGGAQFDGGAAPRTAAWNLQGDVAGQPFSSDGSARLTQPVLTVDARARFDALDLNRFMSPAPPEPAAETPTDLAALDKTPVDLSALKSINGRFSLQAGQLAVKQIKLAQLAVNASLNNGTLQVDKLAAQGFGGRFDATAHADAHAQSVALKAKGSDINVLTLLKELANKDLLEGTGNVAFDLHSSGATVGALKQHLGGSANLALRDGAVRGYNIAKALREAKATFSSKPDATQQASKQEKTDFSELTASFTIANGVAHNDDLRALSPFLRLTGAGDIDVGRSTLNYTAKATVTAEAKGQGGKELEQLSGLTIPVQLNGPFTAMQWKVKWSEVAGGMAKKALKDKLAEQLGIKSAPAGASAPAGQQPAKKSDQVKDLLKGLFK